MKERERKEDLKGLNWFLNLFLSIFVRHGTKPIYAFGWCVPFIIIGCIIFRRKNMAPQKPEYTSSKYNAFWYSLDLFVPFIDMQAANIWMPSQERWFARHYMRVHRIIGWILIPIGIAAIIGIIK